MRRFSPAPYRSGLNPKRTRQGTALFLPWSQQGQRPGRAGCSPGILVVFHIRLLWCVSAGRGGHVVGTGGPPESASGLLCPRASLLPQLDVGVVLPPPGGVGELAFVGATAVQGNHHLLGLRVLVQLHHPWHHRGPPIWAGEGKRGNLRWGRILASQVSGQNPKVQRT